MVSDGSNNVDKDEGPKRGARNEYGRVRQVLQVIHELRRLCLRDGGPLTLRKAGGRLACEVRTVVSEPGRRDYSRAVTGLSSLAQLGP